MSSISSTPSFTHLNTSPISTEASTLPFEEEKHSTITDIALRVLQTNFPVEVLFNHRFNISAFIKDQIILQKLANHLKNLEQISPESIRVSLENLSLFEELKDRLISSDMLELFYQLCSETLEGNHNLVNFHICFNQRIFTVKNALVAALAPQKLVKNLDAKKENELKRLGREFFKGALYLHLSFQDSLDEESFRTNLYDVSAKLLGFVNQIATSYLQEHNKSVVPNLLNWRNPTGYNYHAFVCSSILETCLSALGYTTSLMYRTDLEPKVTLAMEHSIISVKSPFGKRYILDPCFKQFYEDVSLLDPPKEPLLLIDEDLTDNYVDAKLIPLWKNSLNLYRQKNPSFIGLARKKDIVICLDPDLITSSLSRPKNHEKWVETSLKKIWDLKTYRESVCNSVAYEIFTGLDLLHQKTYDDIKKMQITLTRYPQKSQLKEDLNAMRSFSKNHPRSISLFSRLDDFEKYAYSDILDFDPRLNQLGADIGVNAYLNSLCKIVNPDHIPKKLVYGCSGADITSVLFTTDATEITMVDRTYITLHSMHSALHLVKNEPRRAFHILHKSQFIDGFSRSFSGSSSFSDIDNQFMPDLPLRFFFILMEGLKAENIEIREEHTTIIVSFDWKHNNETRSKKRLVRFIKADITKPQNYPIQLKIILSEGIDIFYMKGATAIPRLFDNFIPKIDRSIKSGGFMMTTDKTMFMEDCSPNVDYPIITSEESTQLENLLEFEPHPLLAHLVLDANKTPDLRAYRNTPPDYTYWLKMIIRRKN